MNRILHTGIAIFFLCMASANCAWLTPQGIAQTFEPGEVGRLTPKHATSRPFIAGEILDRGQLDYLEDEGTGRILADVQAVLYANRNGSRLQVTISAMGPHVDPVPGFRGVQGANLITAMELERILQTGDLVVETMDKGSGRRIYGSYRPGRRGRVPERRILADGTLDFQAESQIEYQLELFAESSPLPAGDYETVLRIGNESRLVIAYSVKDGRGQIRAMESLGPEMNSGDQK